MSGYSKNSRTTAGKIVIDWYKILQVSPSSTPNEIKSAYYKIAQSAHPDKHQGCNKKLEQFKRINEAYDVLSNPTKRNEFDIQMGHYHFGRQQQQQQQQQRRTNIPKDYRKVYTSRPPPEWKMVWDHTKHYEMHYGDGFQKEAMKQAIKTAEQDGTFIYHSSLGKGFTFHPLHDRTSSTSSSVNGNANHGATTGSTNYNPYSKRTEQGPPKIIFDYQEIVQNYGDTAASSSKSGKKNVLKHERIVYDLHLRRYERYREEVRNETQQQQQHQRHTTSSQETNKDETTTSTSKSTDSVSSENVETKMSSIYSRYDWKYRQEQLRKEKQDSLYSTINMFSSFTVMPIVNGDMKVANTATTTKHDVSQSNKDHAQEDTETTDTSTKNAYCTIM